MKKLLTTVSLILATAAPALAEGNSRATIQDHYTTKVYETPYTQDVCKTVDVPIYGRRGGGASAADVLGGMIIGGLIGKGVTNKDNGAAAGAVIGGMIAADKNQGKEEIIGYRQETRCDKVTRYDKEYREVYSHSTVTFWDNGKKYSLRFQK